MVLSYVDDGVKLCGRWCNVDDGKCRRWCKVFIEHRPLYPLNINILVKLIIATSSTLPREHRPLLTSILLH